MAAVTGGELFFNGTSLIVGITAAVKRRQRVKGEEREGVSERGRERERRER